jgi:hypothetical protein
MNDQPVPFAYQGSGVWKAALKDHPLRETSAGQLRPTGMVKLVTAVFSGPNAGYSLSNPTAKAMLVNKEDARLSYDGNRSVPTSSKGSSMAVVKLRVIVRDIAATSEPNGDHTAGDVRLAQVTFVNRATGALIATVNVSLLDPGDASVGVATYGWKVDIGTATSKTYTVGMIASNYYQRNSSSDDVVVTVTRQK